MQCDHLARIGNSLLLIEICYKNKTKICSLLTLMLKQIQIFEYIKICVTVYYQIVKFTFNGGGVSEIKTIFY